MYHTVRKPSRNLIKSTREIQQTLIFRIIKESVSKFFFQWLVFNDSMKHCSGFFVLLHTCCTVELLHISQRGKNCLAVGKWCLLYGHFMFLLVRVKSADLYTVKMQKSKCCCGIAGYSNEPWKKETLSVKEDWNLYVWAIEHVEVNTRTCFLRGREKCNRRLSSRVCVLKVGVMYNFEPYINSGLQYMYNTGSCLLISGKLKSACGTYSSGV